MGNFIRVFVQISVGALSAIPFLVLAQAGDYPSRPVSIIVPGPPGGGIDFFARLYVGELSKRWKVAPIVEYRSGASGMVGAEAAARAKPDGYTLLMTSDQTMTQALFRKIQWDPERDLVPIAIVATTAMVCFTNPALGPKTWQELVAMAKANPGKLNYVDYPQTTNSLHLMRLFKTAGVRITPVPFNGTIPGMQAVMTNSVQMFCSTPSGIVEQAKAGKLVVLATTGREANPAFPGSRSLRGLGVDFEWTLWFGMMAPAGTPPAIIAKIQADAGEILALPDVQAGIRKFGLEPETRPPSETAVAMSAGARQFRELAREFNIVPE